MKDTLLIEIGTEELPPKALENLSKSFKNAIEQGLTKQLFTFSEAKAFATPRRLAVLIENLDAAQQSQLIEKKGPSIQAAYDASGQPTAQAQGFAQSLNISFDELQQITTEKGTFLCYRFEQPGKLIQDIITGVIEQAIAQLPIPKRMRWGSFNTEFVRPVHWVVLMYGSQLIEALILGKKTQKETQGHRFHANFKIEIPHANDYESLLGQKGKVIASFEKRADIIKEEIATYDFELDGHTIIPQALLSEVTALVEWPVALKANFDRHFLEVPAEALISAMHDHQKCFHVVDQNQQLLPYFITIANIESKDPNQVIHGNEKVMRARLADAEFFYTTDLKKNLTVYRDQLKTVIFQAELGTLFDKSERITQLAKILAHTLGSEVKAATLAGELCKADLMSDMVGEFPELQGIMGYYYAKNQGENEEVATAIKEHYLPRFAEDKIPHTIIGCIIAIADRMDNLVGFFGINKVPTGDKDPYALRRAALAILRIILEKQLSLDLLGILNVAKNNYPPLPNAKVTEDVLDFIFDRLKTLYAEQGINPRVFAAVLAKRPSNPLDFQKRLFAVNHFIQLPEAQSLAQANKRVSKLLLKEGKEHISRSIQSHLLEKEAEKDLAYLLEQKSIEIKPLFEQANYNEALTRLSQLREPVDRFFDDVMVMVDDTNIRNNRLALLANLRDLFLEIADISLL